MNLGQVAAIVLTDIEPTNHNILWKKSTEDIPFYYDTASGNWLPLNTSIGATITFPPTDPLSVPTPPTGSATWGWNAGLFWWKDDTGTVKTLDLGDYLFDGKTMKASYSPSGGSVMDVLKVTHLVNPVAGGGLTIGDSTGGYYINNLGTVIVNSRLTIASIDASDAKSQITKEWAQKQIGLVPNTLTDLTDTDIGVPLTEGEGLLYDTSISKWVSRPIVPADVHGLTLLLDGKEDLLGNPSVRGLFLTSTTSGVRSWAAVPDSGAKVFTELTDTPAGYTGQAGQAAVVKADESGLEFAPIVSTTFIKLTDTPATYVAGKNIVVNKAGSGVVFTDNSLSNLIDTDIALPILDTEVLTWDASISNWVARPSSGGGGTSLFVGLTDTPVTYSGQKDKAVFVKTDETGLEFRESSDASVKSTRHEFYATDGQKNFFLGKPLADNALVSINGIDVSDTFYNDTVVNSIHFLKALKVSDFVLVLNNAVTTPPSDFPSIATRHEFYATAGQTDFPLGEPLSNNALVSINGIDVSKKFYNDTVKDNIHFLKALKVSDFVIVLNAAASSSGGGGAVSSVFGRAGVVVAEAGDYTKAQVGLGNADNTADLAKPISLLTQNAINQKADQASISHIDNTSDADKPVSTAQQAAIDLKVAKAGDTMTGNLAINTVGANNFSLNSPVGKSIAMGASGSPPEFSIVGSSTTPYQFTSYSGGTIQSALTFKADGNLGLLDAANAPVVPLAPEDLVTKAYADEKVAISGEDSLTGKMQLATVAAMPATPDANTIYFVTT